MTSDRPPRRSQGAARAAHRLRERERYLQSAACRFCRELPARTWAGIEPRPECGRRQGRHPRHDRSSRRRRRGALRPYRRRAGRGAAVVEPAIHFARGVRAPLRPRRLRHEGFRRLRAGDGAGVPGRRPQAPGPHRPELRRGDHLPRLARHHRPVRQGRAASGRGHRRRADHDEGRRRAQERGDLPNIGDRTRSPFRASGAGRERHRRGGGCGERDRPPCARL